MGCYKDYQYPRDMAAFVASGVSSVSECVGRCSGYQYASIARNVWGHTDECRCDVVFGRYGFVNETQCDAHAVSSQRVVQSGKYSDAQEHRAGRILMIAYPVVTV